VVIDVKIISDSYFFYAGGSKTKKTKKSLKEIGDMGYGGEEILFGGRVFPILDLSNESKFKVNCLQLLIKTCFSFCR
jgi:hypothetical protein